MLAWESHTLDIHRNNFNHNFDLKDDTFIKRGSNILRWEILESTPIESYQNTILNPEVFSNISLPERIALFPKPTYMVIK